MTDRSWTLPSCGLDAERLTLGERLQHERAALHDDLVAIGRPAAGLRRDEVEVLVVEVGDRGELHLPVRAVVVEQAHGDACGGPRRRRSRASSRMLSTKSWSNGPVKMSGRRRLAGLVGVVRPRLEHRVGAGDGARPRTRRPRSRARRAPSGSGGWRGRAGPCASGRYAPAAPLAGRGRRGGRGSAPRRRRSCRRGSGRRPCARSGACAGRARRRGSRSRSSGPGPRATRTRRTRCRRSPSRGCRSARRRRSAAGRWPAPGRPPRAAAGRPTCSTGACAPGRPCPRARAGPSPGRSRSRGVHSPPKSIGSITFSTTVSVGSSWKNWKMTPTVRPRHSAVLPSDRLGEVLAGDRDRAAGRAVDAGDHVHQRRLAAARSPDDRDELARGPPGGRRRRAPGTAPRR